MAQHWHTVAKYISQNRSLSWYKAFHSTQNSTVLSSHSIYYSINWMDQLKTITVLCIITLCQAQNNQPWIVYLGFHICSMNYTYIVFEETETQKKLTTQGHTTGQGAKS